MTKFLKVYGSERNHELYSPLIDVKKLYKFDYMTKPTEDGKMDRVMMAPCCEDYHDRYMLAGFKTVMAADVKEMREYTTDLLRYLAKVPDGNIIRTFELVYGDVEIGGHMVRRELEGNWIMEME